MEFSEAEFQEHQRKLSAWIRDKVGIPDALLYSLEYPDPQDDWSFIIKIHGVIEAALNHMILGRLRESKLSNIVSHLETNDRRTGKIAFVKALDLLPERSRSFVRLISEVRNRLVHDVKNFDFNLDDFLSGLDKSQTEQWKIGLTCNMQEPVKETFVSLAMEQPRFSIFLCVQHLLFQGFFFQPETQLEMMMAALQQARQKHSESTAKEQG